MAMEFKRRLPIPMEIREEMPLSAELTAKKQAFDSEVAKVFTGEDARKVLIIGPCSADREDSVLEYMNRLAKTAEEEGFLALAAQFEGVAKIEKTHEERYLKLLDNLKKGEVFRKGEKVMWFCRNCGHVEIAESAPAVCPVCKHPQAYFQIKAENY